MSGADAIILDLEDAVAESDKALARRNLADRPPARHTEIIRINGAGTPFQAEDLAALAANPPCAVMAPKAESAEDIQLVRRWLGDEIAVIPLIETARGLAELPGIARTPGVWFVAFGSVDFANDLGCAHQETPLLPARSEIVLRSRLAGLPAPIDGVTLALNDESEILRDARRAHDLGFGGKLAIHPKQIAPIQRGFEPSEEQRDWAARVVAAGSLGGAARVDGAMIDRPVILRALRILEAAKSRSPNPPP